MEEEGALTLKVIVFPETVECSYAVVKISEGVRNVCSENGRVTRLLASRVCMFYFLGLKFFGVSVTNYGSNPTYV